MSKVKITGSLLFNII